MSEWISTKQAMSLLGVGSTTIKRWADQGRLSYYKTAGGHRRFRRSTVERLATNESDIPEHSAEEIAAWHLELVDSDLTRVTAMLQALAQRLGDWYRAADFVGEVVRSIGTSWADGECSAVEEYILVKKLGQGLSAIAAEFEVDHQSPAALVATISGDRHEIGAILAQVCLRSQGANAQLIGADVVAEQLTEHMRAANVELVALSASAWQTDAASLRRFARIVGRSADQLGVRLVVGGLGAWPETLNYGDRCETFAEFGRLLKTKRWQH